MIVMEHCCCLIHKSFGVVVILLLLFCLSVYSQDNKEKLKADKKKIEEEIEYTSHLLNKTKKTKKISLNQLVILDNKIKKRESLISNINTEINILDTRIDYNNKRVKKLTKELKSLKEEYAKLIYYAFKNRNAYDRLMFVFSSKDFNQAYQRLKYIQQYSSYRKTQAELIKKTQEELKFRIDELELQKNEKVGLVKEKEYEVEKLKAEKREKNNAIKELNKREKHLLAKIEEKKREADKLQAAIEKIIAEEMRAAAERAKAENMNTDASMTEAELALSDDFNSNKGKLPWPSEKGIISSTFGEHTHPVLKKVRTKNNGIDILTGKGTIARSVFNGTVVSVRSITNNNTAVIIRHGEYFSVYSNLINVYVKQGDVVQTGQGIGQIYTNPDNNKTELHFEIWKGKTLLNPVYWISSR